MPPEISSQLPRYTDFDPDVPVWCATPNIGRCIHRFFDTSPISPSGKYLAVTRLPFDDRVAQPGDPAEIVLVDLEEGTTQVVAQTLGWDTQLGAQAQWGVDDSQLFFNDMDLGTWQPYCVKMNPSTRSRVELAGSVYTVSPDGSKVASPSLPKMSLTQLGYGAILPRNVAPENCGAPDDDGLFVSDTATGECKLLASLQEIVETAGSGEGLRDRGEGAFYAFHVKWNPQGDRLMLVLRFKPTGGGGMQHDVITMKADGSDIHVAIPQAEWGKGGHHPNWCPDGETVLINIKADTQTLRLVSARYDGSSFGVVSDSILASGHPTLHPDGRHVLTDVYLHESLAFGDGTTPIRWMDLQTHTVKDIIRINNDPPFPGPKRELRIDPHPAWDQSFTRIAFNGCEEGVRRVYVADLTALL